MLEKFGLSNYENKVYISLLQLGISEARKISNASGVPYGRIYDILENLVSQKLIIENFGRPKQYIAIEPEIVISTLLNNKKEKLDQLVHQSDFTLQELNRIYEMKPKDKLIWKVAIGDDLYPSYFDILKESRKEFLGYVEIADNFEHELDDFLSFQTVITNLKNKGVKIKLLLGISSNKILEKIMSIAPKLANLVTILNVKQTSTISHSFTVIDGEKVILKVVNPSNHSEMLAGVYLWQQSLARTLKNEFNKIWKDAIPVKLQIDLEN